MCLSTPTDAKSNGTTVVDDTSNGCSGGSNCSSIKSDCNGNTSESTLTHRKLQDSTIATATKDFNDNLGYKEENAVYKEVKSGDAVAAEAEYKPEIRWPDLIAQIFVHGGALFGLCLFFQAKLLTVLWVGLTILVSGIGITAGAHRLWSHRSYTASVPLRLLLVFLFTIAGQRDAYTWSLDHRIHHKFSETDADPHNAKRGFFFSHVGWLFLTPHPQVVAKRSVIDMSDLENDKIIMFQRKYYTLLFAICAIALPVLVPWYFWDEVLWMSFFINFNMRFSATLNAAFLVNSVAHMWGRKPYDKDISPVESPFVSFVALGEGWHNYHHVFPWDYKTGEFGHYKLNITTAFIDICAKLGLATARKSVSPDMVKRRAAKCGDGTHFMSDDYAHKDQVWGYGDKDLPREDAAEIAKMQD